MSQLLLKKSIQSVKLFSILALVSLATATQVQAQTSVRSQIAELSQRFVELEQKYNLLKLEVENLTAENNRLKQDLAQSLKSKKSSKDVESAVSAQLNSHRKDTEQYVKQQYDKLLGVLLQKMDRVSQTTTTQANVTPTRPQTQTTSNQITFSTDYPKNGHIYQVQSGDTLTKIAAQFGSKVSHIKNANRITNPAAIQIGQKLFIPVEKQ